MFPQIVVLFLLFKCLGSLKAKAILNHDQCGLNFIPIIGSNLVSEHVADLQTLTAGYLFSHAACVAL